MQNYVLDAPETSDGEYDRLFRGFQAHHAAHPELEGASPSRPTCIPSSCWGPTAELGPWYDPKPPYWCHSNDPP
jgi:NAD-dependent DNA ligase adenylation domain